LTELRPREYFIMPARTVAAAAVEYVQALEEIRDIFVEEVAMRRERITLDARLSGDLEIDQSDRGVARSRRMPQPLDHLDLGEVRLRMRAQRAGDHGVGRGGVARARVDAVPVSA
jgi:hypothetical protein